MRFDPHRLLVPLLLLGASCGARADYELVHLRELLRHGDHAALRAQHELLPARLQDLPAVRELVLAAELDGAGIDSVDLVLELPAYLGRLPLAARELPPSPFEAEQRTRLVDLATSGLEADAPSGSLARRLEVATLLLVGLTDQRGGREQGLDLCLLALDAMAAEEGSAGLVAAGVLERLTQLEPRAGGDVAGPDAADPRRGALARYLEGTP